MWVSFDLSCTGAVTTDPRNRAKRDKAEHGAAARQGRQQTPATSTH